MADATVILESVKELARTFAAARRERQLRRELDPRDFIALRDAGFLLTGVPADSGGLRSGEGRGGEGGGASGGAGAL